MPSSVQLSSVTHPAPTPVPLAEVTPCPGQHLWTVVPCLGKASIRVLNPRPVDREAISLAPVLSGFPQHDNWDLSNLLIMSKMWTFYHLSLAANEYLCGSEFSIYGHHLLNDATPSPQQAQECCSAHYMKLVRYPLAISLIVDSGVPILVVRKLLACC